MRNRCWNASHTPAARPLPQRSRRRCAVSFGARAALQQVAAQLADVLERGAVPADDVVPELARREPLAHDHRAARHQHRARCQHTADAVVHGQAVVQPVARLSRPSCPRTTAPTASCARGSRWRPWAFPWCRTCRCRAPVVDRGRRPRPRRYGHRVQFRLEGGPARWPLPDDANLGRASEVGQRVGQRLGESRRRPESRRGRATLMQCASARPVRLVLSSATTTPRDAMPSQAAMYSGRLRHQQADGFALGQPHGECHAGIPARRAPASCGK